LTILSGLSISHFVAALDAQTTQGIKIMLNTITGYLIVTLVLSVITMPIWGLVLAYLSTKEG